MLPDHYLSLERDYYLSIWKPTHPHGPTIERTPNLWLCSTDIIGPPIQTCRPRTPRTPTVAPDTIISHEYSNRKTSRKNERPLHKSSFHHHRHHHYRHPVTLSVVLPNVCAEWNISD
ncbi:hypothetical protein L873DRAFT_925636 [Choiromyces venosus 120613-1]|uniref:Uncharacterized protein n=1 Tax=Choiromyces venosus 120613-1 TaxID=1336337 RepID=A0A3N4JMD7_9PEZI|nr:hypothetical protein L873DRAFT_925636 [Choiromyces venosus 120613-1]